MLTYSLRKYLTLSALAFNIENVLPSTNVRLFSGLSIMYYIINTDIEID